MKPIQERAEMVLLQALKCAQYRLPNDQCLKASGYFHAMALRYGLLGATAGHFIFEIADPREERDLRVLFQYWPKLVADHYRDEVAYRVPYIELQDLAPTIGSISHGPMKLCLAMRKQFLPLQQILETAADVFIRDHRNSITADAGFFRKRQAQREFKAVADDTIRYAMYFLDRRRAGLEEVSEIALLGE